MKKFLKALFNYRLIIFCFLAYAIYANYGWTAMILWAWSLLLINENTHFFIEKAKRGE